MPKCKKCKKSIRPGDQAVEAMGGKWCWHCFVCTVSLYAPFTWLHGCVDLSLTCVISAVENHLTTPNFTSANNVPFAESVTVLFLFRPWTDDIWETVGCYPDLCLIRRHVANFRSLPSISHTSFLCPLVPHLRFVHGGWASSFAIQLALHRFTASTKKHGLLCQETQRGHGSSSLKTVIAFVSRFTRLLRTATNVSI